MKHASDFQKFITISTGGSVWASEVLQALRRTSPCPSGGKQQGEHRTGLGLSRTAHLALKSIYLDLPKLYECSGLASLYDVTSCVYTVQTAVHFLFTVPEIPPSEVSGGGGSRSELVITWDVSSLASSFLQRMIVFIQTLLKRWISLAAAASHLGCICAR